MSALKDGTITPGMRDPNDGDRRELQGGGSAAYAPARAGAARRSLTAGEVGYFTASIKNVQDTAGRRHRHRARRTPAREPLPGYRKAQLHGLLRHLHRRTARKYPDLRDALEKLQLNDAVAVLRAGNAPSRWASASAAASSDCCTWRSSRSGWSANSTWTSSPPLPSVIYRGHEDRRRRWSASTTRTNYPDPAYIEHAEEPYRQRRPSSRRTEYVGNIMAALPGAPRRVTRICSTSTPTWSSCTTSMPLNEIIYDFFDALKASTKGYASLRLRALGLPAVASW